MYSEVVVHSIRLISSVIPVLSINKLNCTHITHVYNILTTNSNVQYSTEAIGEFHNRFS